MHSRIQYAAAALVVAVLFSSCWTRKTISRADAWKTDHKVYILRFPRNFSVENRTYLISSFVQFMSYETYDAAITKQPFYFGKDWYEYTVTVPGSTPVIEVPQSVQNDLRIDSDENFGIYFPGAMGKVH